MAKTAVIPTGGYQDGLGIRLQHPGTGPFRIAILVGVLVSLGPGSGQLQPQVRSKTPILPVKRAVGSVTVLEHDAAAFDRAARLGLELAPIASAGGAEAGETFDLTRANSVVLLSDGRIAAFSTLESRLLVFRRDGRGQHAFGRKGQGPGEFVAAMNMLRLIRDTLLIPDQGTGRLNWVLPDRGLVASTAVGGGFRGGAGRAAGVLPGGRLVLYRSGLVQPGVPDSVTRPPIPVIVLERSPHTQRQIASIPDLEVVVEGRGRGQRSTMPAVIRFTRSAHVVVWDTLIATAVGAGYEIDLRNGEGRVISQLRVLRPRRFVTKAMREAAIAFDLERVAGARGERALDPRGRERQIREAPTADSLPPYESLHVTPNKTLWVVDPIARSDTAWNATAFRTDGAILGRLHGSSGGRPVAFGDDRVVLRSVDRDGVVSLKVHRIRANGATAGG